MPGTLYLAATPIGNLEDLAPRTARVLGEVAVILAEDTRETAKLLRHLGLSTPLRSFHDHTERRLTPSVMARLAGGEDVALVSDAGTPLISDPGHHLVREAIAAGIAVVPLPGPSAVLAALCASGLPSDRFTFLGFFPRKEKEARELLAAPHDGTVVFFESPHRIAATLALLADVDPGRHVVLARELTKVHEEILRGTAIEVARSVAEAPRRGEMVLLLGPPRAPVTAAPADAEATYRDALGRGLSRREALREASRRSGLPRREVYRRVASREAGPSS